MSDLISVFTSADAAATVLQRGERTIVCRFKNPARAIAINMPTTVWDDMKATVGNPTYVTLLDGIIEATVKRIVSSYYLTTFTNHKVTITGIPSGMLAPDTILEEATNANSGWLSKEELETAWRSSATRARIFDQTKYAANSAYRKAYTRFEELILKLSGKTSQFDIKDLDVILAKLADEDFESDFGRFVVRRIEAIKAKPVSDIEDFDLL